MSAIEFINGVWPVVIGFITLVIVLAKMHSEIETLKDKGQNTFRFME
jgi:hypothetical protein